MARPHIVFLGKAETPARITCEPQRWPRSYWRDGRLDPQRQAFTQNLFVFRWVSDSQDLTNGGQPFVPLPETSDEKVTTG